MFLRIWFMSSLIVIISAVTYIAYLHTFIENFEYAFYKSNQSSYFLGCYETETQNVADCQLASELYIREITPVKK